MSNRLAAFRQATMLGTAINLLAENNLVQLSSDDYEKIYYGPEFPYQSGLENNDRPTYRRHEPRPELAR